MKLYNFDNGYSNYDVIMGSAREIKSLERNIFDKTGYTPIFSDTPKFNMTRWYGIVIDNDSDNYVIISEHECLRMLMEEV